jgi:hypothetical protein
MAVLWFIDRTAHWLGELRHGSFEMS